MKEWHINRIHFTHRPLGKHRSNYEVVQNTSLPSTLSQHHLASFHDNHQPVTEYANTVAFLDAFVQWIQPLITLRSFNSQDNNKFDKWSQGTLLLANVSILDNMNVSIINRIFQSHY